MKDDRTDSPARGSPRFLWSAHVAGMRDRRDDPGSPTHGFRLSPDRGNTG